MFLLHNNKPKSSLPYNCHPKNILETEDIKPILKEILDMNEGEESVDIAVYDCKFEDTTLVELCRRYLNLSVFNITIIDPMKVYDFSNALSINVVVTFSKPNALKRVELIKKNMPYAKTHLIDEYRYSIINVKRSDFDNKAR